MIVFQNSFLRQISIGFYFRLFAYFFIIHLLICSLLVFPSFLFFFCLCFVYFLFFAFLFKQKTDTPHGIYSSLCYPIGFILHNNVSDNELQHTYFLKLFGWLCFWLLFVWQKSCHRLCCLSLNF
jgi:hypothetical protein